MVVERVVWKDWWEEREYDRRDMVYELGNNAVLLS